MPWPLSVLSAISVVAFGFLITELKPVGLYKDFFSVMIGSVL